MARDKSPTETTTPSTAAPDVAQDHAPDLDDALDPSPHNLVELNVYQRVNEAAKQLNRRLAKRGKNTFHNYAFTSHDDIVAAVRGPLISCGVHVKIQPKGYTLELLDGLENKRQFLCKMELELEIRNTDKPDDFYTVMVPAYAMDTSDKAIGKAISYGKKYGLSAMMGLMLATGEDADTDSPQVPQTPRNDRDRGNQGNGRDRQQGNRPQGNPPRSEPATNPPRPQDPPAGIPDIPANKDAADELLGRYADVDAEQLDAEILLTLCDAMAVKLGCPTGNYASKVALEHTKGKAPAKTNVLKSYNAMQMRYGYWARLKENIIARNEGNEDSAKEALKAYMTEKAWGNHEGQTPVWKLEPAAIAAAVTQFLPAE